MRRILIRAVIAGLTLVLATFALPASAHAASGVNTLAVSQQPDGSLLATTPDDWAMGRCTLFAGSTIRMLRPDPVSNVTLVIWEGSGRTSTRSEDDIWNLSVVYTTGPGDIIATTRTMHSPILASSVRRSWQRQVTVAISPVAFDIIGLAALRVSC